MSLSQILCEQCVIFLVNREDAHFAKNIIQLTVALFYLLFRKRISVMSASLEQKYLKNKRI